MGFEARYDSGTCPKCNEPIKVGEEIEFYTAGQAPVMGTTRRQQITRYEHVGPCPTSGELAPMHCYICGGNWRECDCP